MSTTPSESSQALLESGGASWQQLARSAAQTEEESSVALREILVCDSGNTPYGIPVEDVREVVRVKPITPMPRVPGWVLGVVALRGEIVQVVDLQQRLGAEPIAFERSTRIVVLHGTRERVTGLAVDSVRAVLRAPESAFEEVDQDSVGLVTELCDHEGEFVSIVDVEAIVGAERSDD